MMYSRIPGRLWSSQVDTYLAITLQQWDRPQGQGPRACPSLLPLQTSCPGLELVSQEAELQVEGGRNIMWNVAWSGESWLKCPQRFSVPSGSNPDSFRNYLTPQLLGKSICLLDTMFSFSSGLLQACLLGILLLPFHQLIPLHPPGFCFTVLFPWELFSNSSRSGAGVPQVCCMAPWQGLLSQSCPDQLCDFQFSSVAQSCPTLYDPMDCSMPGFPVHHLLPEFTQTHGLRVSDAIQPSHPLSSPSPPTFNLSQHQSLFKWVSSLHQGAKVLEFQLQHQSFQWIFRTDLL